MNEVKTESANNSNAEILAEVRNFIVKINNMIRNGSDRGYCPEYYVDLMSDEVVQRFGRKQLEDAVRGVTETSEPLEQLSAKYTALCKAFNENYFDNDPRLRDIRVEVRYWIGWPPIETTGGGEISLVASCEAVMVRQLLLAMAFYVGQASDPGRITERFLNAAGAPICVQPKHRYLSAEEFIASADECDPSAKEEWFRMLRENRPAEGEPLKDVIYMWDRGPHC